MSNAAFLIAAYAIVIVGLGLYVFALWRQQASLAERHAASVDDATSLRELDG